VAPGLPRGEARAGGAVLGLVKDRWCAVTKRSDALVELGKGIRRQELLRGGERVYLRYRLVLLHVSY
jgi:hypothetical protein